MRDLTEEMFEKLLLRLDADRDRAGEKYNGIQRKLGKLFQWRGFAFPEKGAQEVINRLAKRIGEGEQIVDIDKYVNVITKHVLLEFMRQQARDHAGHELLLQALRSQTDPEELERQDECFVQCMQTLSAAERRLIGDYFQGEKTAKIESGGSSGSLMLEDRHPKHLEIL